MISLRLATKHELQTVYSLQDCLDMLDIADIDMHNRIVLTPKRP